MKQLGKRSIIRKTAEIGISTAVSRLLGLIRELALSKYLGVSRLTDAFLAAYKLPNFMRKIFAEGALSGVLVPAFVHSIRKEKKELGSLVALILFFFETIVFLICAFVFLFPERVMVFIAPGFDENMIALTVPLMQILIFFIFFISSSAILGSVLQADNHFQIPAWGQVFLNITFIGGIYIAKIYNLPVTFLCYTLLVGAFFHFLLHIFVYFRLGFSFDKITLQTFQEFKPIMLRAIPTLIVVSVMEINTWIDSMYASYIPGSFTLLHYGSAFMRIPLGVFGVAFSTILLPQFARIKHYAPSRLSFYVFEATKLIFFITIPSALLMSFCAKQIFLTLFVTDKFSVANAIEASRVLIAFLIGLFFFSLNKILLNVYYAYQDLITPMIISVFITALNALLNGILIKYLQTSGLALATSITGGLQSILYMAALAKFYNINIYWGEFLKFCIRFLLLLAAFSALFILLYIICYGLILHLPSSFSLFFLEKYGYWFWVLPLAGMTGLALFASRKLCGIKLYFFD